MIRLFLLIFISFIFYSFLGWCFEMVHMGITTKEVVNRGFFNGPIIPIYGVGSLIIIILLNDIKENFFMTLISIILICSILEYTTSYFMEKFYKIRWWDYTDKKFNLNGRICLETMSMFVIMALGVIYYINPLFMNFILKIKPNLLYVIGITLLILFIIDYAFSNMVLNKYLKSDLGSRKDKTPDIRKFTKDLLHGKF